MYRLEDLNLGDKVTLDGGETWSCPLATECDLQDLKEYDQERYDEWKDCEFDPNEAGADLVLVGDEELIKKLGY